MTVTFLVITVHFQEIVLGELKDDGKKREELAHNFVMDMAGKAFNNGPIVVQDGRSGPFKLWNKLGDIVYLSLVENTWTYLLFGNVKRSST